MIKTLRITSVIAVILAVSLFAFLGFFGLRGDEEKEQFLSSTGVIERFRKAVGGSESRSEGETSPLVAQAKLFSGYLNPVKPPKPQRPDRPSKATPDIPEPPADIRAKFEVVGTCFYESSPEESLVLIDEPGKGLNWVRQSSVVGHLTIEEVKDGSVILRTSKGTSEVVVKSPPQISLLDEGPAGQISSVSTPLVVGSRQAAAGPVTGTTRAVVEEVSAEDRARAEEIFRQLEAMAAAKSLDERDLAEGTEEEAAAATSKIVSGPGAGRITSAEAERLDHLGRELENVGQDPNRAKSRRDLGARKDRAPGVNWRERKDRINRIRERARRARERITEGDDTTAEQ